MGKFIIVTFGLLGWGFYVLSGGADFVPEQRAEAITSDVAPSIVTRADTSLIVVPAPTPQASIVAVSLAQEVVEEAVPVVEAAVIVPETAPLDLRAVAGNRVNMRSGPSTSYGVLDTLVRGTQTEVIEVNADGWARVRVVNSGQIGWMAERLLTDG